MNTLQSIAATLVVSLVSVFVTVQVVSSDGGNNEAGCAAGITPVVTVPASGGLNKELSIVLGDGKGQF
jgi:hypothetical protein